MNKKPLIVLITIFSAAAAVLLLIYLLKPDRTINLAVPWNDPGSVKILSESVQKWSDEKRRINVRVTGMELGELNDYWKNPESGLNFDLAVTSSSPAGIKRIDFDNVWPWTGVIWSLYYNKSNLESIGWKNEAPERFRTGNAEITDLEAVFTSLKANGITPLGMGSKYIWPLGALIQHITLYENPALNLNQWEAGDELPAELSSAVSRYERWNKNGWFSADHESQDWPASVLETASGESAFVLIPASLSSTIPPELRDEIGIIPFPTGKDEAWSIGSIWYLAVPDDSKNQRTAGDLAEYLTEQKTTMNLQQEFGRLFFSRDKLQPGILVSSVTDNIRSDFMAWLSSRLREK